MPHDAIAPKYVQLWGGTMSFTAIDYKSPCKISRHVGSVERDDDLTSTRIDFHKRVNKYAYRPIYTCIKRPPNTQRDRNRLALVNSRNLTIQHCTRTGRDSVRHIHQQQVLINSESETIQMRNRYINQC